jgi:hypothetical protein
MKQVYAFGAHGTIDPDLLSLGATPRIGTGMNLAPHPMRFVLRPEVSLRHVVGMAWICLAMFLASCASSAETINVNASVTYQTMRGWEAITRGWEINKGSNAYDPTWVTYAPIIADRMVNELGANRIAMPLSTGWANPVDYWSQFVNGQLSYTQFQSHAYEATDPNVHQTSEFDFYADTVLVPMKQRLEARGEKLYVNMIFGDFALSNPAPFSFKANPAAYAAFAQFYVDRLKTKYGVVLDSFSIINEPDNSGWDGVDIGKALVAVKTRLSAAGYPNLDYMAPSVAAASNTIPYAQQMTMVAGAMPALTTLTYHRYQPGDYNAIYNFAHSQRLETGMSEYFNATMDTLFDDLLLTQVSSWQKWAIANRVGGVNSPQAVYYRIDLSSPGVPVVTYAPNTPPLSLVFRHVRLGAVRVDAQSPTMRTLAFVNTDGTQVLVARRAPGSGSASVAMTGLKPGTYGMRTATANSSQTTDLADVMVAAAGTVTVNLPEGYTTLYGKSAATIKVVEYHHAEWDHYFMTADPTEIAMLDAGIFQGWARTGYQFNAYPTDSAVGSPVCRFFSTSFAPKSSHFYTPFPSECTLVEENPDWSLEGVVFAIPTPDENGDCFAGTVPVYRLYNNGQGGAPNHRYTTDFGERSQMLAQGWISEGYGPDGTIMCSPV